MFYNEKKIIKCGIRTKEEKEKKDGCKEEIQKRFGISFYVEVEKKPNKNATFKWYFNFRKENKKLVWEKRGVIEEKGYLALHKISDQILERESNGNNPFSFPSKEVKESARDLISQKIYECYKMTPEGNHGRNYHIRLVTELVDGKYLEKEHEIDDLQDGIDALFKKVNVMSIRFVLHTIPDKKLIRYVEQRNRNNQYKRSIFFEQGEWNELTSAVLGDWEELAAEARIGNTLWVTWDKDALIYPNWESKEKLKNLLADELEKRFSNFNDNKKHKFLIDFKIKFNKNSIKLLKSTVTELFFLVG